MTRKFMLIAGAGLFVIAGAAIVTTAADAAPLPQDTELVSDDGAYDDSLDAVVQPDEKKKGKPGADGKKKGADFKKKMMGKGFPDMKKKMMFGKDFKKKMPGKGPGFMKKGGPKGPPDFKKKKKADDENASFRPSMHFAVMTPSHKMVRRF